jgi:hypothetical protein
VKNQNQVGEQDSKKSAEQKIQGIAVVGPKFSKTPLIILTKSLMKRRPFVSGRRRGPGRARFLTTSMGKAQQRLPPTKWREFAFCQALQGHRMTGLAYISSVLAGIFRQMAGTGQPLAEIRHEFASLWVVVPQALSPGDPESR